MGSISKSIIVLTLALLVCLTGCKTVPNQETKSAVADVVDFHTSLTDFDTSMVANSASPLHIGSEGWRKFQSREFLQALAEANDHVNRDHTGAAYRCRGMIKIHMKDMAGALADFNQAVKIEPDSEWSYGGRALTYVVGGLRAPALADCIMAVSMSPTNAVLLGLRGYITVGIGSPEEALRDCNKALQLNTNVGFAYSARAGIDSARKAWDLALSDCNQAIRCKIPEYSMRGWILANQQKWQAAVLDLNRAIEVGANISDVYTIRGWCHLTLGNLDQATLDVDQAIQRAPKTSANYELRARVEMLKGDWGGATVDVDRAIELDPKNMLAWTDRVDVKVHSGDWAGALDACHRATELNSSSPGFEFSARAVILAGLKDYAAATAELDRAIAANPNQAYWYAVRGNYKRMKGEGQAALLDFDRAIELSPQLDSAYADRGLMKSELGFWDPAKDDLDRAVTLNPRSRRYYVTRGLIKNHLGDVKGALTDVRHAIDLEQGYTEAWKLSADLKIRLKDIAGAIADLDQAMTCRTDDPAQKALIAYQRAGLYRQLRDEKSAYADYSRAIELNPALADAYLSRAEVENTQEDPEAALEDCNRYLSLNITERGLLNRAINLRQLGRCDQALIDCDRAIALNPRSPNAFFQSALAKRTMGNLKGALADLNQSIDLEARPNFLATRAGVQFDLGNFNQADLDLIRALKYPQPPNALAIRASFKEVRSDYDGALVDWRAARDGWRESQASILASCRIWLLQMRLQHAAEADSNLRDYLAKLNKTAGMEWPMAVGRYLLGDLPETDLLGLTSSKNKTMERGRLCEFNYYTGMKHLLAGDKQTAITRFQKAVDSKMFGWFEYRAAQAELRSANQPPRD